MYADDDPIEPLSNARLSYKFQRLREQLRNAIASGELRGRLPGERELGRRFSVNAKTVNKALCDLAGEGLVIRRIGKGTFVNRGNAEEPPECGERTRVVHWLAFNQNENDPRLAALLLALEETLTRSGHRLINRDSHAISHANNPGHSFFRTSDPIDAVVFCQSRPLSTTTLSNEADALLLALARRQITTVFLGAAPASMKRLTVIPDYMQAGFHASEWLLHVGCKDIRVFAMESCPEARNVVAGCHAAGRRRRQNVTTAMVSATPEPVEARIHLDPGSGVVCIGGDALDRAIRTAERGVEIAAVLEPGDDRAARHEITAYEFDPTMLGSWAARLAVDSRAADPTLNVFVPGRLEVRGPFSAHARPDWHSEPLFEAIV